MVRRTGKKSQWEGEGEGGGTSSTLSLSNFIAKIIGPI